MATSKAKGGDAAPELVVAHSLAVDECASKLYVADREGGRVVAFDLKTYKLARECGLGGRAGWGLV